jgi:hypothetical protein
VLSQKRLRVVRSHDTTGRSRSFKLKVANMSNAIQKNGFDRVASDIVGDHIRKGKAHDWYRGGDPADMCTSYAVIVTAMCTGESCWKESKLIEVIADYVVHPGVPDGVVREGFGPYSSGTKSVSDRPAIVSGSQHFIRDVDPLFKVTGWAPRFKFAAITGDDVAETPAIAAPEPKATPKSSELLNDSIPF